METFYLLIAVPLIVALIARLKFKHTITWQEMSLQMGASVVILSIVWFLGSYSSTHDTEIWNGYVTEKVRDHGHYLRPYDCNCYESCSGSGENRTCQTICQTCYEDRYTVHWFVRTTIGDIRLQYFDRGSRSVYNSPDPSQYVRAYIGEPCSRERGYTNYIQAVPESLFNMEDTSQLEQFESLIPEYPRVYDYYRVNRVLPMGVTINRSEWNDLINERQKHIGNSHQVNMVLILVNTPNQMYRHALERAWLGGEKNDVIVMIGTTDNSTIGWVDTITLGSNEGNSLMTVEMRDNIMALGTIEDAAAVVNTMADVVVERFDRKPMADYEYLKDEIDPPTWVVVFAFILAFLLSIGGTILFHHKDVFGTERYRSYRRYR